MAPATARVQRDASLYLLGKGGAAVGVVLAIPLVSRGLGAHAFAEFALWSGISLWCATACVGWLQNGIGRLHRERCGGDRYLASVRFALGIGALASAALVMALAAVLSELSAPAITAFGLLATATALFMGSQALAQADLQASRVVTSDLVRGAVLPLTLGLAASIAELGIAAAAAAHAFALFVAVAVARRGQGGPLGAPSFAALRPLLRYGLPIGLWSVICLASAQLGRVALELYADAEALALYAGMQDVIVKGGTLLLMPVCAALHAHAMAWWAQGDHASIRRGLRRAFTIQGVIGGSIVLGALIGGPLLARILFGDDLPPAATTIPVAALLSTGVVATNMGLLAHKGLELGHSTGTMVALACATLLANGIACALLVPLHGAIGAALAFALSQVGYAVAAGLCSRRRMVSLGAHVPI